jgi:hypothetical protein
MIYACIIGPHMHCLIIKSFFPFRTKRNSYCNKIIICQQLAVVLMNSEYGTVVHVRIYSPVVEFVITKYRIRLCLL